MQKKAVIFEFTSRKICCIYQQGGLSFLKHNLYFEFVKYLFLDLI
jgi:hypothetical protein